MTTRGGSAESRGRCGRCGRHQPHSHPELWGKEKMPPGGEDFKVERATTSAAWHHCPECGLPMVLAGADYVCVRERMATPTDDLANAIIDLCWKATPYGVTEDDDTAYYLVPKGALHRLIGRAQSAGIPAAFRVIGQADGT